MENWLDITKQYATETFWKEVFNQNNQKRSQGLPNLANGSMLNDIFPRCDVYEENGKLLIEAELPGIARENFQVMLRNQEVIIKGMYSTLKPKLQYYLKERSDRSFEKGIHLPVKINKKEISCHFEDGLLRIFLPIIHEEEAVPIHIHHAVPTIVNETLPQEE